MKTANDEYTTNQKEQIARLERAEEKVREYQSNSEVASKRLKEAEEASINKEKEKQAVQGELDDLLMVFGDLEDKVTKYKDRLKELGENVSDGEDGEEEEGDDDVD